MNKIHDVAQLLLHISKQLNKLVNHTEVSMNDLAAMAEYNEEFNNEISNIMTRATLIADRVHRLALQHGKEMREGKERRFIPDRRNI